MSFANFEGFLYTMYDEKRSDDLYTAWLSNPFQSTSFEEFKAANSVANAETQEESEEKAADGYKKAMDILGRIGGEVVGN